MNIVVAGSESNLVECRNKFGKHHQYTPFADAVKFQVVPDVLFDFVIDGNGVSAANLKNLPTFVFLNATANSLSALVAKFYSSSTATFFGFAGMPTFLDREVLEVSLLQEGDHENLKKICDRLATPFQVVADKVGMVTPRVICMIVNEAYYTAEDGTASRADIDMAMKLGTNYPFGPFEWCEKIGIANVYALLEAVYTQTKDERYTICPLLKSEYFQSR